MREKERLSPPTVGGSSLLVIFAVLCLTMFALLSLSTVRANGTLDDAAADAVLNYYEADCRAEELLARLRNGELPEGVTLQHSSDGDTYSYTCVISDTRSLEVEVRLDGESYTVLRWQTVSTAEWEPDDALDLWDGNTVTDPEA